MDKASVFGVFFAAAMLLLVFWKASHGNWMMFWSDKGLYMVGGGCVAVIFMAMPMHRIKQLPGYIKTFLFEKGMSTIEVIELLPQVSVPTLVLHCREDGIVPFDEGRRMAAMIPGARFVPLDGRNHLILEAEPAWPRFLEEVRGFLAEGAG